MLVGAASVLVAAPRCYEFPHPVDAKATVELDGRILGNWACLGEAKVDSDGRFSKESNVVALGFAARNRMYEIRMTGFENEDDVGKTTGYPSKVGDRVVLNIPDDDEKHRTYTLVSPVWLSPDVLQIDLVNPDALSESELASSASVRKALGSRTSDAKVFEPFLVCVRAQVDAVAK